jgi:phycoerythrobilin:ferredoxin oxidoreductase
VFNASKDYLQAYLDFCDRAEPETDPQKLAEINRFDGWEWTEEYIHGFLFDLERKLEQV